MHHKKKTETDYMYMPSLIQFYSVPSLHTAPHIYVLVKISCLLPTLSSVHSWLLVSSSSLSSNPICHLAACIFLLALDKTSKCIMSFLNSLDPILKANCPFRSILYSYFMPVYSIVKTITPRCRGRPDALLH